MRLNDIANQYAALSEISVRQANSDVNSSSRQDASNAISALSSSSNPQYERQLERARSIANERAQQSNNDFEAAQRREQALRDSGDSSRELANIIDQVREGDLQANEREELQERFDEILNRFDSASTDTQETNSSEDAFPSLDRLNQAAPPSSEELGQGVSERFENLQAVRELDFNEATPEELEEAAAVIERSQNTLADRERQANVQVNDLRNERNVFANVAQALDGNADFSVSEETQVSEREERLQRDTQAVQELIRQFDTQRSQNPTLSPGSLFNLPA